MYVGELLTSVVPASHEVTTRERITSLVTPKSDQLAATFGESIHLSYEEAFKV